MDGLEAVELKISEVLEDNETKRFDSEYFKKEYLIKDTQIKSYQFNILKNLSLITDGEHGSPDLDEDGKNCLSSNNIDEFFINENETKRISLKQFEKNKRVLLKKENILLSIVGTIGKCAIVKKSLEAITDRNLATIKNIDNRLNKYFLTTFLNSAYGKYQTQKLSTGNVQPLLNLGQVGIIKIPILSNTFQSQIEILVKTSYQKLESSKTLYKEAEELLLKELDLLDFKPSEENIATKSFKESFGVSGRLDSEYYQPKYDQIERIIREHGNFTYIKNEFNYIKTSFDKSKDGYNYIEIGDVNVSDGTNICNYVETENLPANAKINIKNGDLLVSTVRPYRGAITIINTNEDDLIVSGAFTVLRKKENSNINTQVLQVLLRTKIYKELLLKFNVGTQYPVIKDEDVLNLIIPNIDNSIQTQIEEKIKKSFELKEVSKQLLDLAKRAVEIAIEKNEDEAIKIISETLA